MSPSVLRLWVVGVAAVTPPGGSLSAEEGIAQPKSGVAPLQGVFGAETGVPGILELDTDGDGIPDQDEILSGSDPFAVAQPIPTVGSSCTASGRISRFPCTRSTAMHPGPACAF